jgi:hypothetical protein
MWERVLNEPVLLAALVRQAIALSAAFGFGLTEAQTLAVMAFVETLTTLFTRAVVTPNRRLE